MCTEKNALIREKIDNLLFQDKYGILQLTANAMLISTSKLLRMMRYLCLKFIQWANTILILIKEAMETQQYYFFAFIWMESSDCIYEIFWKKFIQKEADK